MLPALTRLLRTPFALIILCLSKAWDCLLSFTRAAGIKRAENEAPQPPSPDTSEAETRPPGPDTQGFPAATDDQYNQIRKAFIESLDPDAICDLASEYNHGKPCRVVSKSSGSFNVCFFVEFDQEEPKWIIRIPIEPALDNPWDKLLSEVATIEYLVRNTRIPVPHVHAYGRGAKLARGSAGTQMFLVLDLIPGKPLDKRLLLQAGEEHRRGFCSQLVDTLAELRKLEFPSIGCLAPNPDGGLEPVLGPVMAMSAATLRLPPQPAFASAAEYMRYQFSLVSAFFLPPVRDHTIADIKEEMFALHEMERIFHQAIDPKLDRGPFVLYHLDLRSPNIIVDENLQIQGIIDWEFSGTIPRQAFTPPTWITGHDSIDTDRQMHMDFRSVLDEKSKTDETCDQLRREWYGQSNAGQSNINPTDMAFCVAHVLRRPTDASDTFYDFFAPKLSDGDPDGMVSEFFNGNQALALEAQRRAEQCDRYTQYLKDNGLYETEVDKLLAASKDLKAKFGWA